LRQEINSLKANEEIFKVFLKQQPFHEVRKLDSKILFGNPDAKILITIFSNPFCNPCAIMHKRIEKLLEDTNNEICVQYILASFEPSLHFASKGLIAIYLQKTKEEKMQLFSDWFEEGKLQKEAFFEKPDLDTTQPEIETEFQKHEAWREKTKLNATPTILVNGYQLPENYKIEDLRYFTDIEC
jgi:protein-disulfide isomerase